MKAHDVQPENKPDRNYLVELALLLTLATLWSISYTFMNLSIATIPPITVTAVRAILAGLLLLLIARAQGVTFPRDAETRKRLVLQSALNSIIPFTLIAWAQTTVDASVAVILSSTSPIFAFFLTWAIARHEASTGRKLFGVAAGLAGICLIVGAGTLDGIGTDFVAQIALVAAAFSYACAAIFGRYFDGLAPIAPAAGTLLIASVVLVPASLIVDRPWTLAPSMTSLAALAALTIFSTALAYVIYFRLLKTIGSIGVTSQSYLRIPIGVLFGVVFLGETLRMSTWFGLAFVFVGVIAMTLPAGKSPKAVL